VTERKPVPLAEGTVPLPGNQTLTNEEFDKALKSAQDIAKERFGALETFDPGMADDSEPCHDVSALHFLPDKPDWDARGDLRGRIAELLGGVEIEEPLNVHYHLEPEPGERRPNFGQLYVDWHWFNNIHGILNADVFHENLDGALSAFVDQIKQHQETFKPVRFQVNPGTKYGLAYHDWFGEPFKFDIRVLIQFGTYSPEGHDPTPGLHFFITTLVAYDLEAENVEDV
jgi:hypothetical protein